MNFRALCLSVACLPVTASFGQNLVGNGSFEEFSDCPTYYNQVERCVGWFRSANNNDPEFHTEYLNACNSGIFSAPSNTWGSQAPLTGDGYMALCTMSPEIFPNYRENIYTELLTPTEIGAIYTVRLSVSHTDNSQFATNNLGIKLSTSADFPVDDQSQVMFPAVVTDKNGWITLFATFTADAAFTHLAIGNFMTDANTTVVENCPSCPFDLFGYYVDDVCLTPATDDPCTACKEDLPPLRVASPDAAILDLSPTLVGPGISEVRLAASGSVLRSMEVFDAQGRLVQQRSLSGAITALPANGLANGAYSVSAVCSDGTKLTGRFVVAR